LFIAVALIGSTGRRASVKKSGVTGPVGFAVLVVGVIVYLIEEGYLVLPS